MKDRKIVKARNLPFVVTKTDGTKKRFKEADSAWRYMSQVNGSLTMAFRAAA